MIKKFENFIDRAHDEEKKKYFESLIGRYVIFTYNRSNLLYLVKLNNIYYEGEKYFVEGHTYVYNNKIDDCSFNSALMNYIKVKSDFKTYDEAFMEYELLQNANKYNL